MRLSRCTQYTAAVRRVVAFVFRIRFRIAIAFAVSRLELDARLKSGLTLNRVTLKRLNPVQLATGYTSQNKRNRKDVLIMYTRSRSTPGARSATLYRDRKTIEAAS